MDRYRNLIDAYGAFREVGSQVGYEDGGGCDSAVDYAGRQVMAQHRDLVVVHHRRRGLLLRSLPPRSHRLFFPSPPLSQSFSRSRSRGRYSLSRSYSRRLLEPA